jgi:ubiquinol-cytochrome c reductase subunit 7
MLKLTTIGFIVNLIPEVELKMSLRILEKLKSITSSKPLAGLAEWHSNNMGYRKMGKNSFISGLVFDDLVPEEGPVVKEAIRRLPPKAYYDRLYRFRRALNLSMKKDVLPKEEWTKAEEVYFNLTRMSLI